MKNDKIATESSWMHIKMKFLLQYLVLYENHFQTGPNKKAMVCTMALIEKENYLQRVSRQIQTR